MPTKEDVGKGIIRFGFVWATSVAIILNATHASDAKAAVASLVPGLIMAIEKTFIGV